ncbi:MAG: hypothetical protein OXG05_10565 [Gammaproteobacteria bacterium]|nr:hypothetical protein [Gammaproteobacteria bacterium]
MTEAEAAPVGPNQRVSVPIASGLGLQLVALMLPGVVLIPTIVFRGAGQAEDILLWGVFAGVVVCGAATMLQAVRFGIDLVACETRHVLSRFVRRHASHVVQSAHDHELPGELAQASLTGQFEPLSCVAVLGNVDGAVIHDLRTVWKHVILEIVREVPLAA